MKRIATLFALLMAMTAPVRAARPAKVDSLAIRSLQDLQERAEKGDNNARFRLARTLEKGYGRLLPRDSLKARNLYEAAAERGFAPAQNYLGFLLFNEGRYPEAIDWMMRAARQGDITAYSNLGWMLLNGKGAAHDTEKALFWLRKGAREGAAPAAAMLGDIYRAGKDVTPDSTLALRYYDLALTLYANARYRDARANVDIARGINALFPDIEAFTADSLMTLGRRYLATAPSTAMRFIAKAADKGDALADALMGKAYAFGYGVEYNHALSTAHYLRAAKAGNAAAQFVLGELLQLLPDALSELPKHLTADLSKEQYSGEYWTQQAHHQGITDARKADEALGEPKFP